MTKYIYFKETYTAKGKNKKYTECIYTAPDGDKAKSERERGWNV